MRFVEIVLPEAGKLDEHKAVVELTADDLERLRRWRRGQAVNVPGHADYEMAEGLADTRQRLLDRIEQAATSTSRPRCSCGAENCVGTVAASPAGEDA